jgi:hypothetical protein
VTDRYRMTGDLQQFGTIETPQGSAAAMLCIDADRPNEFLLQWVHQDKSTGRGLVCEPTWTGTTVHLAPKVLWRAGDNGGLFLPRELTSDERRYMGGATIELTRTDEGFHGAWQGPDNSGGAIELKKLSRGQPIEAQQCTSWADFKIWADSIRADNSAMWFRGHGSSQYTMMTTLHRLGRNRLERYCFGELIIFNAYAEGALNRRFDLSTDAKDYATVIALAQHHGLPTPLLDCTASPYVAAFFAFSDAVNALSSRVSEDTHVRVLALSPEFVQVLSSPIIVVPWPRPYVNTLTVGPLHNPRLQAQQGRFLVTNVADLETYIRSAELRDRKTYLTAVDVPVKCAVDALKDLAFMGVTGATMFPGLDGVGRMMNQEMSYHRFSSV